MAKSKFYLKEPKSNGETPVIFFFSYAGKRLKYYPGITIHPSDWNEKQQVPKNQSNNSTLLNQAILMNQIRSAAEAEYSRLILMKEIPTHEKIKLAIDTAIGKIDRSDQLKTLLGYTRKFIDDRERNPRYKKGSITVYNTCLNHLESYCPNNIALDDIDKSFLKEFVLYLQKQKNPQTKGYFTQNHVNKVCSTLKTIFAQAIEDEDTNNPKLLLTKKIFPTRDKPTKIALTKDEVKRIYNLDIKAIKRADGHPHHEADQKYLEITRDLFCMACFTGLRYSDFSKLKKANFVNENDTWYISKRTQKTNEDILVPLNPLAVSLMQKYDGAFPEAVSNQKMNASLKTLGKAAEINDVIIVARNEGGIDTSRECQKWELISTHTGRRSMVTNSLDDEVPPATIQQLGGWKSTSSFEKYNKLKQKEHAKKAAKHRHFNKY